MCKRERISKKVLVRVCVFKYQNGGFCEWQCVCVFVRESFVREYEYAIQRKCEREGSVCVCKDGLRRNSSTQDEEKEERKQLTETRNKREKLVGPSDD